MKKTLIIYHSEDFDGYFSCILSYIYAKKILNSDLVEAVGYDYSDKDQIKITQKISEKDESIDEKDIIFCDCFYIPKNNMQNIIYGKVINKNFNNKIIIDHHSSNIDFINKNKELFESWDKYLYTKLDYTGINKKESINIFVSATFIAYDILRKNKCISRNNELLFKLISEFDIFGKNCVLEEFKNVVLPFQYNLKAYKDTYEIDFNNPLDENSVTFNFIVEDEIHSLVEPDNITKIINNGKTILKYTKSRNIEIGKNMLRQIKIQFLYKNGEKSEVFDNCYLAFEYGNNSLFFEDNLGDDYKSAKLCIMGEPDPINKKINLTIISPSETPDAGELCSKFGGGGHKVIGGCIVKEIYKLENDDIYIIK